MYRSLVCQLGLLLLLISTSHAAISSKQFREDYASLVKLVNDRSGELLQIDSFTYVKDVAEFRFGPGTFLLQRPVNGRPTVAAFVGTGHVRIDIPVPAERHNLYAMKRDTMIDEDFTVCFIRMADDLDLQLKQRFKVKNGQMAVADYQKIRDIKGEYYFKPTRYHAWDNLAQLLISAYERRSDGYFWASFDHTFFSFDPNRPEEISIGHARNPDIAMSDALVSFQRKERNRYGLRQISQIDFPLQMSRIDATLELSGADGWRIDKAEISTILKINRDSVRFPGLFMDRRFDPDSIFVNSVRTEWFRRKDFYHLLLLTPDYVHKGDTLNIAIWYSNGGSDYYSLLPWMESGEALDRSLRLVFPPGYNYALPMAGAIEECGDGRHQCTAGRFYGSDLGFRPMVTNYDTTVVDIDSLILLKFVSHDYGDIVKEKPYQDEVTNCFRFFMDMFGNPSDLTEVYIFPGGDASDPGLLNIPPVKGDLEMGGFQRVASERVARQWIGPKIQPASYREYWMAPAISVYLGLMYVEKNTGATAMYTNLKQWKVEIEEAIDRDEDIALSTGLRGDAMRGIGKGVWMLHMLRILMRDLEHANDDIFLGFLRDILMQSNNRKFSNYDFCALAESHTGIKLDWFFNQWLYGRGLPVFTNSYTVASEADGHYVDLKIETSGVPAETAFPVLFKVIVPEGAIFARKAIAGQLQTYRLGPFPSKPQGLIFNEYESILCQKKSK
ncbi:MAG: hypothetical protein IPH75_03205 [bacterium]|nr:hypothetical protein [bacterium]